MSNNERRGRGRPPGATNLFTRQMREQAAATGELPHEFLLRVSRGGPIAMPGKKRPYYPTFEQRFLAADKAAPYYAPRLSSIGVKAPPVENPWAELLELVNGSGRKPPGVSNE
jgi:hypothetical protein